jgi:hypothetical protein
MGFWPLDKEIPWERPPGASSPAAPGQCLCDNMFINELADTVIEALPMIAQVWLSFAPSSGTNRTTLLIIMALDWLLHPHVIAQGRT